jgi:hypothetical protein
MIERLLKKAGKVRFGKGECPMAVSWGNSINKYYPFCVVKRVIKK